MLNSYNDVLQDNIGSLFYHYNRDENRKIWDYEHQTFRIPYQDAEMLFKSQLLGEQEGIDLIINKLQDMDSAPFSLIRLSINDVAFLASQNRTEAEMYWIRARLGASDIDPNNIPDPAEYPQIINQADLVCSFHIKNTPYPVWGPTLDVLKAGNILFSKKFIELHTLYWLIGTGALFHHLAGKKVVLVGGKAEPFYKLFFKNPHYCQMFPQLQLDTMDIVGVIPTPDYGDFAMNSRKTIEEMIRSTYVVKPDVFLFGLGVLGNYLSVMVKNDGFTGIDIGASLDAMMNWPNSRPGLEEFTQYQHPELKFEFEAKYPKLKCIIPVEFSTL